MNKQRVLEAVNIGLSGYEFTKRHRQALLAVLKREKPAGKRVSVHQIATVLVLIVILAAAVILLNAFGR